jgi:hypothetical protein
MSPVAKQEMLAIVSFSGEMAGAVQRSELHPVDDVISIAQGFKSLSRRDKNLLKKHYLLPGQRPQGRSHTDISNPVSGFWL